MKRIFKLFMAVAAVAGVTACTTDATEDLGVNLNGGQTTLTLSLDDTRTQLGAQDASGVYALTWAENDAISVNGSVSNALAEDEAGATTATFTFNSGFGSAPYFIAYPATSTNNQVVFAAEQTHTSNTTFGNGAAVMYGYATDLSSVKLNHLTGVLKIGVVSGTTTPAFIKEVRISTVDRKPIAGAFNVDAEGKLTATEGATKVITYKSESDAGFLLLPAAENNPVTYIHVAVPAGVYGELYVTLESADGVMYKTVTTDSTKPVNAGAVREFSNNIEFVPTDKAETFVIADYSDLYEFKGAVEGGSTLNAVFVNDVEMPVVGDVNYPAWEPINAPSYTGTITGNGYAIKGLYAPLFNVTAASFKGLHLVANVEEKSNPNFGAFARQLIANGNAPKVEHCSVNGSITINTAIKPTASTYTEAATGAFVGIAKGIHFENCVNNAALNIKSVVASDAETATHSVVGGFIGYTCSENNLKVSFTNCENNGDITYVSGDQTKITAQVGGFVAVYDGNETNAINTTFDNCSNSGDITTNANIRGLHAGGFVGMPRGLGSVTNYFYFTNSAANSGKISKIGTSAADVRIGGFFGYLNIRIRAIFNCPATNSGAITISGTHSGTSYHNLGGFVGFMTKGSYLTFNDAATNTDTADIKVTGSMSQGRLYCGGFVGRSTQSDVTTRINFFAKTAANNAEIYVKSTLGADSYVGGIIGYSSMTGVRLNAKCKLINNGAITLDNTKTEDIWIGGINGGLDGGGTSYESGTSNGIRINKGNISFSGEATGACRIGGLAGYHNLGVTVLGINTGNITVTAKFNSTKTHRIGGAYADHRNAAHSSPISMQNAQVYCDIIAYTTTMNSDGTYTFVKYPNVGIFSGQASIKEIKNCKVGGRIALGGTVENGTISHTWTTMNSDNYLDYMVGVRNCTISTESPITNQFTNITLLSSINDIDWGNYGN